MHSRKAVRHHSLEAPLSTTKLFFSVRLCILCKCVRQKSTTQYNFFEYSIQSVYALMKFVLGAEEILYLQRKMVFSSIKRHHSFEKWNLHFRCEKGKRPVLQKEMVSYDSGKVFTSKIFQNIAVERVKCTGRMLNVNM